MRALLELVSSLAFYARAPEFSRDVSGHRTLDGYFRGFNRERFEPWILKSATDHWHDFSPCIGADFAYKMGRWGTESLPPPEMERMYISPYRSGFG